MSNPLLSSFNTAHEMPPFSKIETDHYEEAIEATLAEAKEEIQSIIENDEAPSFGSTIEAVEKNYNEIHRSFST